MQFKRMWIGLALVGAGLGIGAQRVWAIGPAPLAPRGAFTVILAIPAIQAGDCGPLGPMALGSGIDATSPFFMFEVDIAGVKQVLTYRPRNSCGSCSVMEFGDGGIAAVADFRTMFERWKRSSHPVLVGGGPPCANGFAFGGGNQCSMPCLSPITMTPRDVMFSAAGPGMGGAVLFVVINPLTWAFEDFKFEYSVFN